MSMPMPVLHLLWHEIDEPTRVKDHGHLMPICPSFDRRDKLLEYFMLMAEVGEYQISINRVLYEYSVLTN